MIEVTKLKYLGDHRLHAAFSDGTAGEHDFSALVAASGPMGEPLRDPAHFARVFLEDGAPTWLNGFDMDPEWLRREIERLGRWCGSQRHSRAAREARTPAHRHGHPTTPWEEGGQQSSVTRERIRQIEA
jgi:hypothetical protein